jgi:hypothetical protein
MTYFECYADESLLEYLGFSPKELRGGHSFGRSNVCLKLKKVSHSLGLVDEDPNSTRDSYLKYLLELKPRYIDDYVICSVDPNNNNKLIVLRPNLEGLLVKLAKEKSIDLRDPKYGLESDWRKLHDILRIEKNIKKRKKYIEFVNDISDHKAIVTLKKLVK